MSNVDDSILGVRFGQGLRAVKRSRRHVASLLCELESLPEHEVDAMLDLQFGALTDDRRSVYVLEGTVTLPYSEGASLTTAELNTLWRAEEGVFSRLEWYVSALRLFKEGAFDLPLMHLYQREDGKIGHDSGSRSTRIVETGAYSLGPEEVLAVNEFLDTIRIPFEQPYLALAHENFDQSYEVEDPKLKFLLLMIAMEVMFNDGPQELRYRIARGAGVLLGRTEDESGKLFRLTKSLYDARSLLVHTGRAKNLDLKTCHALRDIVRRSLRALVERGFSKEVLSEWLTASGFGAIR